MNATRRRPERTAAASSSCVRCIECGSGVRVPVVIVGGPLTCPVCSTQLIVGGRRSERRRRARSDARPLMSASERPADRRPRPWRVARRLAAFALIVVTVVVVVTDLDTVLFALDWLSHQVSEPW